MNIDQLNPPPIKSESFKRNRLRFVPETSGCYALATFGKTVLYIGLAKNLRKRFNDHLDTPAKTAETKLGRAVLFFWIESSELNKIERTWLNIHTNQEGSLPLLNSIYSPTFT